jgi:hypothetical protein
MSFANGAFGGGGYVDGDAFLGGLGYCFEQTILLKVFSVQFSVRST